MYNLEKLKESLTKTNEVRDIIKSKGGRLPHNHINVIYYLMSMFEDKPIVYFEIGTYHGGSMITSMRFNGKCRFYGLDFFGGGDDGQWSTRWGNQSLLDGLTINKVSDTIKFFNINNHEFELIQGDSQHSDTVVSINNKLSNTVDIFFIDGDHSYQGVINDFNNYKNIVKSGGFIIFDDYGFLEDVRKAVEVIDKSGFEIIGRLPLVDGNEFIGDLDEQLNASFILRKK